MTNRNKQGSVVAFGLDNRSKVATHHKAQRYEYDI